MRTAVRRPESPVGLVRALELMRFAAVGATSTVLYLALYAGLVLTGVGFLLASVLAFLPVVVYSYLVHDRWTFRTRTPTHRGLGRWLLLQGTMLGLNSLALWGLVVQAGVNRLLAQVLLLPLLPPTTYLLSRRRVFGAT
ncbi:MAG: hypothetical protein AVDCRST_MAG76-1370 [uncultured Acidimicrobiales bacterium]|uniref:GtrA/DPMS transmembrane domain-containing protein n=1 Tax=uncultured Acidimicrobiales bacterium TaxID=310071 RepID=A0A6J4HT43_9ACTN|nr:MAG: hypothetical protein AVDCRST_MAG76-1370 [uncultured Acidimicrobiales bacterium]